MVPLILECLEQFQPNFYTYDSQLEKQYRGSEAHLALYGGREKRLHVKIIENDE